MRNQRQSSGDNSQQFQVHGDLHQGLTLSEAIEVAELTARKVMAEEFAYGEALGMRRIEQMNESIIGRLEALDRLDAFADPAFQVSFRKAQIGAASTERETDYELLASLLEDRAVRGDDRPIRAGLNLAIQIVDQLDEAALIGLTVLAATNTYSADASSVGSTLDIMERLMSQLPLDALPSHSSDWLDHLDVLGACRITQGFQSPPYEQLLANATPGLIAVGIEDDSEALRTATAAMLANGRDLQVVPHELKPGYVRLPWPSSKFLARVLTTNGVVGSQYDRTLEIAITNFGIDSPDTSLYAAYAEAMDNRPGLRKLRDWRNGIQGVAIVTGVGKLLARANAERYDREGLLPPMD